jgi:peptide/nickel transport system substrate-binding protein
MNIKNLKLLIISILLLLFFSCNSKKSANENRIVIGISSDVQSFNTLFAFSYEENIITDLLFPGLFDFRWNNEKGELEAFPMIAESWQWSDDSSSLKFILRDDIYWTDGTKLTSNDVVFSYDVFSDPEVQSRLTGTFNFFYTDNDGRIDIEKSFSVLSPTEFIIHFPVNAAPDINDVSIPVIPENLFADIRRDQLSSNNIGYKLVTCGAYKLKEWNRNQSIVLQADSNSFLFTQGQISELVFKIVPDYTSRVLQLKKADLDLIELVKVEDIKDLKANVQLEIFNNVGREYDYVGWNNIDPELFSKGEVNPNKFFGSSNVRKALTLAINRKEILDEYLLDQGKIASSPISPIFKSAFNNKIEPYDYNPDESKKLLAMDGWRDIDKNGIIEKDGTEFKFKMYYPVGNPLREYASTIVKNNLGMIGIEVTPEKMELGTFIDNLYERKFDAWMAGWGVPISFELKPFWYSNPDIGVLNFACYGSSEVDSVLNLLDAKISDARRNELIKKFQEIIHKDEPVTFLYWTPNIVAYNKRIKKLNITPHGVLVHCWEWTLNE